MSKGWKNRQAGLIRGTLVGAALSVAVGAGFMLMQAGSISAEEKDDDKDGAGSHRSTNSSPIAITSDDKFVWSVNPDNNSVSVFKVAGDANTGRGDRGREGSRGVSPITTDDARRSTSRTWSAARCR